MLRDFIGYYMKSKEFDPKTLERVLGQEKEYGAEYVMATVSDESREFYLKARGVAGEAHRAKAFLRFEVCGDVLVAKADFENNINEMVLEHFMRRFPKKKVVLITREGAFVGKGGTMAIETAEKYLSLASSAKQDRDIEWETFYDSQYIETRRNRKLAMKNVPKKLWKKYGLMEGEKIDRGIPGMSLANFM